MKNAIIIILIFIAVIGSHAQTDSIFREEIARKVNEYRKSKDLMPTQLNRNLNRAAEDIIKKGYTFRDKNGNYNKDSIRKVLRFKNIYDYQFDIVENTDIEKAGFIAGNKLMPKLQSATNDPKHNCMGMAKSKNHEIIIMSKHYVEFDINVTLSFKLLDPTDARSEKEIATIKGNTELNKLTSACAKSYNML
jgi:hypothetical protein